MTAFKSIHLIDFNMTQSLAFLDHSECTALTLFGLHRFGLRWLHKKSHKTPLGLFKSRRYLPPSCKFGVVELRGSILGSAVAAEQTQL